jgi:hypothetical protein
MVRLVAFFPDTGSFSSRSLCFSCGTWQLRYGGTHVFGCAHTKGTVRSAKLTAASTGGEAGTTREAGTAGEAACMHRGRETLTV